MDIRRAQNGLRFAAVVTIGFGLLTAAAAVPALQPPAMVLVDFLFWPLDGAQPVDGQATRLLSAIAGGIFTAWGVCLWMLSGEGMRRAPDLVRRIVLTLVLSWFAVDSTASVLAGAPLNVVANAVFLAMYLWPLRGLQGGTVRANA